MSHAKGGVVLVPSLHVHYEWQMIHMRSCGNDSEEACISESSGVDRIVRHQHVCM